VFDVYIGGHLEILAHRKKDRERDIRSRRHYNRTVKSKACGSEVGIIFRARVVYFHGGDS